MGYLIELRIGYPRKLLIKGIHEVAAKYHLTTQQPETAHMSLFGSFECKKGVNIGKIKDRINHFAGKYNSLRYYLDGFACKKSDSGWAIAYNIIPSKELKDFNEELRPDLWSYTKGLPKYMMKDPRNEWYHITIAFKLNNSLKDRILRDLGEAHFIDDSGKCIEYVKYPKPENECHIIQRQFLPIDSLRITLIHGSQIHAEYDLVLKKWYNRDHAKNKEIYGHTLRTFRKQYGIELSEPRHQIEPTVFITSDIHFDDSNIIKNCARPFQDYKVGEMNNVLIKNWNYRISPEDTVYFLGDFAYPRKISTHYYRNQLNGNIHFIKGDLDDNTVDFSAGKVINYNSIKFLLLHNPPNDDSDLFDGWVIHGHTHNFDIINYPLVNFSQKRINISPELTNYQPVNLGMLYHFITTYDENILFLDGLNGLVCESQVESRSKNLSQNSKIKHSIPVSLASSNNKDTNFVNNEEPKLYQKILHRLFIR